MLTHLPQGMRHAIARFCKGKTFHGAWHRYANLAPAEESFIGQAKVFDEDEAVRLLKPEYRQGPGVAPDRGPHLCAHHGAGHVRAEEEAVSGYAPVDARRHPAQGRQADDGPFAGAARAAARQGADGRGRAGADQVPDTPTRTPSSRSARAAARHLPKEWYDREKLGFPVPIKIWLRQEKYYRHVRALFEQEWVGRFFDQDALLKMPRRQFRGQNRRSPQDLDRVHVPDLVRRLLQPRRLQARSGGPDRVRP